MRESGNDEGVQTDIAQAIKSPMRGRQDPNVKICTTPPEVLVFVKRTLQDVGATNTIASEEAEEWRRRQESDQVLRMVELTSNWVYVVIQNELTGCEDGSALSMLAVGARF